MNQDVREILWALVLDLSAGVSTHYVNPEDEIGEARCCYCQSFAIYLDELRHDDSCPIVVGRRWLLENPAQE